MCVTVGLQRSLADFKSMAAQSSNAEIFGFKYRDIVAVQHPPPHNLLLQVYHESVAGVLDICRGEQV